jgi:cytochrome bd ubiquinol oxidase subunit I
MQAIDAARIFMADSLGFHIIFVLFGLTIPVLVCWFEWIGIHKQDSRFLDVAFFWSKIMTVLVISGVISGTVVALQMSLVWPGILQFGGQVIGLPFMLETYAFIIEAVFLSLYMVTWNSKKISRYLHLLFGVAIIIGSTMSAYLITSVDAWMNLPTGFTFTKGVVQNIQAVKAMFSGAALIEFFHSMAGYYLAASLAIVGIYGFKLLRTKALERESKSHGMDLVVIRKVMVFAGISLLFCAITGDLTGKYLAKYEPSKLATIELVETTSSHVPLVFGGVQDSRGNITGPHFEIPDALSILAGGSASSVVKGLDATPVSQRPPAYIRALYQVKLFLIGLLTLAVLAFFALKLWRPSLLMKMGALISMVAAGFLGIVLVELGWMITEIGRQPWAVRGYLTTSEAVTKTHDIATFGYFFPIAFALLAVVTVMAIYKLAVAENTDARSKA